MLLPIAFVAAIVLVWQGVPAGLVRARRRHRASRVTRSRSTSGRSRRRRRSRSSGTNGGGIVNANSAHPFENPTPLTNLLEQLLILVIPFSLTATFGVMAGDRRQGWAIFAAHGGHLRRRRDRRASSPSTAANPLLPAGLDQALGNMEGKEVRFGASGGGLWAAVTTGTSTGAVNAMHDSLTPLGGLVPLFLILLGEITPGGVGAGLYGMLVFALLTVFIAGLMVGRTPEYLGKKVESYEMKMSMLVVLVLSAGILGFTALATATDAGRAGPAQRRPARLQRDPLRLREPGRQQRVRLRRPRPETRPSTTSPAPSRCWSAASR